MLLRRRGAADATRLGAVKHGQLRAAQRRRGGVRGCAVAASAAARQSRARTHAPASPRVRPRSARTRGGGAEEPGAGQRAVLRRENFAVAAARKGAEGPLSRQRAPRHRRFRGAGIARSGTHAARRDAARAWGARRGPAGRRRGRARPAACAAARQTPEAPGSRTAPAAARGRPPAWPAPPPWRAERGQRTGAVCRRDSPGIPAFAPSGLARG